MSKEIIPIRNGAAEVVVPKPTKAEVIEAMVLAKAKEHEKRADELEAKRGAVRKKIVAWIKAHPERWMVDLIDNFDWYLGSKLSISVDISMDEGVKRLLKEFKNIPDAGYFNHRSVREEVTEALRADPIRVKALSESPQIARMLKRIEMASDLAKKALK